MAVLLHALARYSARPGAGTTLVGAFVAGFGLTNQHTLVLFALPMVAWVLLDLARRKALSTRLFIASAAMFLLGLAPYAYLPWASRRLTPGSWGDQTTLSGPSTSSCGPCKAWPHRH